LKSRQLFKLTAIQISFKIQTKGEELTAADELFGAPAALLPPDAACMAVVAAAICCW